MKKFVLLTALLLGFVSCDWFGKDPAPTPGKVPGQCISNEEAAAMGIDKKCNPPGCVCVKDVHGKVPNDVPHCHSDASLCTF